MLTKTEMRNQKQTEDIISCVTRASYLWRTTRRSVALLKSRTTRKYRIAPLRCVVRCLQAAWTNDDRRTVNEIPLTGYKRDDGVIYAPSVGR